MSSGPRAGRRIGTGASLQQGIKAFGTENIVEVFEGAEAVLGRDIVFDPITEGGFTPLPAAPIEIPARFGPDFVQGTGDPA